MTPRRAFLLGMMGVALVAAVVYTARLVGPPSAPGEASVARDGHTHAHDDGDPGVVQFYRDPKPLPDFAVETLEGTTLRTADLKGKGVIVNFWATWCPPCKAEIPDLIALQERYRDHVVVLGLSMDEIGADQVRAFVTAHEMNYPVAMVTPALERLFPPMASLPTSYIVDRDGLVVQKYYGMLNAVRTEREARVLAGLSPETTIERVDADKPLGLADASQLRRVPGVDLSGLTPEERGEVLQALNEEGCTCGCGMSVARCRVEDPACSVSLPRARQIVDEIARR